LKDHNLDISFELEHGHSLSEANIRYHTYGKLNAQKSNVIVAVHALTASSDVSDWWKGLFGTGKFFDPEKYFIICANNLGSSYGTTCANDVNPDNGKRYGLDFPQFTIRDTARLHLELLKALNISQVKFLIGGSCGGNISQEMAIIQPNLFKNMILLCCAVKESPWLIGIHESQRMAMNVDPTLHQNNAVAGNEGLRAARAMVLPYYRSFESFVAKQSETDQNKTTNFRAASYLKYQGEKFVNRFSAHAYYTLLSALDTHNIARNRESVTKALNQITANTLVIGFDTDLLIPTSEQKTIADGISHSHYSEISTLFGHDAFLIEAEKINRAINQYFNLNT